MFIESWEVWPQKTETNFKKFKNVSFDFSLSRILNKFYNDGGKMPGVPRKRRLPWSRTLPYFVFWMATLLPFLATKWGRSAYWKMWLLSGFGSVSYMMFLFGKVQRWCMTLTHIFCTLRWHDNTRFVRTSCGYLLKPSK